jgi:hypothetical protein
MQVPRPRGAGEPRRNAPRRPSGESGTRLARFTPMNIKNIDWRAKLRPLYRFATKLPPVVRSLAGLALIAAGFLGIVMPILGFWMAPLGVLFIAADIPPWRRRVEAWLEKDDGEHQSENATSEARSPIALGEPGEAAPGGLPSTVPARSAAPLHRRRR